MSQSRLNSDQHFGNNPSLFRSGFTVQGYTPFPVSADQTTSIVYRGACNNGPTLMEAAADTILGPQLRPPAYSMCFQYVANRPKEAEWASECYLIPRTLSWRFF